MLSDKSIRNAKPSDKPYRLYDSGGLYLEVATSGGKWFRLKFRFGGKEKRLSMGVYPDVSLKRARERRDEARKQLAEGINPSQLRSETRKSQLVNASNTFEAIAREWHSKQINTWSESHGQTVIRRLELNVFPWLGSKPINEIGAPELLSTLRLIENRGAIETAHRVLGICGQVLRYAIATGRLDRDPSSDLRGALTPVNHTHRAAMTEPNEVAGLLRMIDGYHGTLPVRCALRLAPLVFLRPGELRHAQWKDIDFEKREWRFLVTKTDSQHVVPLSDQAVGILKELEPLSGKGRYVFPNARNPRGDKPMSDNAVLSALRRMGIEKEEMCGHGFRAMARTILDEVLGYRPDFIEHQLAHKVRDPNGRAYNRTAHLAERHKMMQEWSDYLDDLKKSF